MYSNLHKYAVLLQDTSLQMDRIVFNKFFKETFNIGSCKNWFRTLFLKTGKGKEFVNLFSNSKFCSSILSIFGVRKIKEKNYLFKILWVFSYLET